MSNIVICICRERGQGDRKDYRQKYILHIYGFSFLFFLRCVCENCVYANYQQNRRVRIVLFEWKG